MSATTVVDIERYLLGAMAAAEAQAFLARVRQSPDELRELGMALKEQALLFGVMRQARAAVAVPVAAPRPPRPVLPRRLVAFPEVRRAWWPTLAAAALLIGLGVLFTGRLPFVRSESAVRFQPAAALIREARGTVRVVRHDRPAAAQAGQTVAAGDRLLVVGEGSSAVVVWKDGTSAVLRGDSELALKPVAAGGAPHVFVRRGDLSADVAPQPAEHGILFETPHVEVRMLGTRFVLQVLETHTSVETQEGQVALRCLRTGETAVLAAGDRAVVGERMAVAARGVVGPPARTGGVPENGLLALYTFAEGAGGVVHDVAGVGEPLDLHVADPEAVRWLPGGALAVLRPTLIASTRPAARIAQALARSNELTVEAWIRPAASSQGATITNGPARIVTISTDFQHRNFTLGQWADRYHMRLRTTAGGLATNWAPSTTPGAARTRLSHVVFTRNARDELGFYVDGTELFEGFEENSVVYRDRPHSGGFLTNWDETMRLGLANEFTGKRSWLGEYHRIAIYDRAWSAEEVLRARAAGPAYARDRTEARAR